MTRTRCCPCRPTSAANEAGDVEGRERMMAGVAIRAALRAASMDSDNFDALSAARVALGTGWLALESAIHRLADL